MAKQTQVSARISPEAKRQLDDYVRESGLKKERVVETALLHHLQVVRELPADVMVHPEIIVTPRSMSEIARRLSSPVAPTQALRDLMAADGD